MVSTGERRHFQQDFEFVKHKTPKLIRKLWKFKLKNFFQGNRQPKPETTVDYSLRHETVYNFHQSWNVCVLDEKCFIRSSFSPRLCLQMCLNKFLRALTFAYFTRVHYMLFNKIISVNIFYKIRQFHILPSFNFRNLTSLCIEFP